MLRTVLLIAQREYADNAKTKGFWIGILTLPLLLYVMFKLPALLDKQVPTRTFVLLDSASRFEQPIDRQLAQVQENAVETARNLWAAKRMVGGDGSSEPFVEPRPRFARVPAPPDVDPADPRTFRPYLLGERTVELDGKPTDLFALVVIPEDLQETRTGLEFWCKNLTDTDLRKEIVEAVEGEIRREELERSGLDPQQVNRITQLTVRVDAKDPQKEAGAEQVTQLDTVRQWAPVAAVYLLWAAIITVSQMLLTNMTEEKSSRVVEVLLSSVTPGELMFGKLLGIAGVGLTMVGCWIGSTIALLKFMSSPEAKMVNIVLEVIVTPELLGALAGYFLLGYLLYAGVFLAIGSVVNSLKEAQNLMGTIMLVMAVPLATMFFVAKDPNGTLAVVLSWIPPYTPFVMMNRAAASPPLFDVVGTLLCLLLSVAVTIWLSGRIFRIGVLRTGQPPKFLELLRWIGPASAKAAGSAPAREESR